MPGGRSNQRRDERRYLTLKRGTLRLKQRGNEERMVVELHGTDLPGVILRNDSQRTREERWDELSVQAVSAPITFCCLFTPIVRRNPRARPEAYDACRLD